MIKLKRTDTLPDDASQIVIDGEDIYCYFDGDVEINGSREIEAQFLAYNRRAQSKFAQAQIIKQITVTTSTGNTFDGNEISQQRMHRAIEILNDSEVINWSLADNTVASVTRAELREALRLAFLKQSDIHINQI